MNQTQRDRWMRESNAHPSTMYGRVMTSSGGAPNEPVSILAFDAVWTSERARDNAYVKSLEPATLTPIWAVQKAGSSRAVREIIDAELKAVSTKRPRAHIVCCYDIGQDLAATSTLIHGRPYGSAGAIHDTVCVTNGTSMKVRDADNRHVIGARPLVSWFNQMSWRPSADNTEPPKGLHVPHYAPGQIILDRNPDRYETDKAGALDWSDVGKAAASTESLVKRPSAMGEDLLDLTADESVAVALMLAYWTADHFRPSGSRPIERGLRGIV